MNMVEQVARAICQQQCFRAEVFGEPCLLEDGRNGPCEANDAQLYLSWRASAARAAIKAMREPTEEMKEAGGKHFALCTHDTNNRINQLAAKNIFEGMVDAALSGQSNETGQNPK